MDDKEEDKSLLSRGRHILDGLAPVSVFVATMVITVTVFTLKTIEGWQALAAAGVMGNFFWMFFKAATYDHLETTVGAVFLSFVGGNFVRFIWEVIVLIYDRTAKFNRLRSETRTAALAEGEAKGRAEGMAEGIAVGKAEGEAAATAEQNRKWQGWVARRDAAREKGLPFDEPPPAPIG